LTSDPEVLEFNEPDDDEYIETVRREFLDQVSLYPEAPELSGEEPFSEQKPGEDVEHG